MNIYLYFSVRYLELQSGGRTGRNEIRFYFTYLTSNGVSQLHEETFLHRLADDKWHKISLSVSSHEIELIIDCRSYYKRVTRYIPDRNFSASNMQLFVGQRNSNNDHSFKVSFNYVTNFFYQHISFDICV